MNNIKHDEDGANHTCSLKDKCRKHLKASNITRPEWYIKDCDINCKLFDDE